MNYTITIEDETGGVDIVTFNDPIYAVSVIESARRDGLCVEYTGDPFVDQHAVIAAQLEG